MATGYTAETPVGAWAQDGGYNAGVDQNGSSYQVSHDQQEQDAQASYSLGDNAADEGSYDPASLAPPQVASQLPAKPSPKPPKSAGGFLVEESDDEDDTSTPVANGPKGRHSSARGASSTAQAGQPSQAAGALPSIVSPTSQVNTAVPTATEIVPAGASIATLSAARARLSNDPVKILEDNISEDPRGAMDSWLALMAEHRKRNKTTEARKVYERFLKIFPTSSEIWVAWLEMELDLSNFSEAENLFRECLLKVPTVQLLTVYLDYVRRRNDLSDSTGRARETVSKTYNFVLDMIGFDKDAGDIWADYISFIQNAPGTVGGSGWQDQQKMDLLRKAYQRAICMPISNVNTLWKEYNQFEMGLNKTTGRKFLAERSPTYMSAKSAATALDNITRGLQRTTLPRLPPAPGFDGDKEYLEQVELWKKWIAWEKTDPLDLEKEEPELLQKRINYAYKQSTMALRFWPEIWTDAAEYCFDKDIKKDGVELGSEYLQQGMEANPESVLLALKQGERIESTMAAEENDDAKAAKGNAVREPHIKVLDTLYALGKALREREKRDIARVEEAAAATAAVKATAADDDDDDDKDEDAKGAGEEGEDGEKETPTQKQVKAIAQGYAAQSQMMNRVITSVWIALTRAMRRIQGKGKPGTPLGGMREVFTEARKRGRLTSDIYVAVAQMEWLVYKDPVGAKIFERGQKLFPEDEYYTIEYLKFLHAKDDNINARVVFETFVNKVTQKPDTMAKAKPLYVYFHKYEAQFGDLSHMLKYEKRMAELFPEDPKLANFSARYSTDRFDPVAARIIISPATQLKPKLGLGVLPSVEQPTSVQNSPRPGLRVQNSPRPGLIAATNSPKRPLPIDDLDDSYPPRKALRGDGEFQRGASPLKGAAGRRLDQQRKQGGTTTVHSAAPAPIARDITFLLSQIPPAHTYNSHTFNPAAVVKLLQETSVPDYSTWNRRQEGATGNVSATHDRPPPGAFGSLTGRARDSPAPGGVLGSGQPLSPYIGGSGARLPTAAATYGPPPGAYRPGSSGEYEPPPSVSAYPPPGFAAPPPQIQNPYGAPPPPELGGWAPPPQYGAPSPAVQPPPGQFGVYGAPPGMGGYQPPQAPPGQFGGAYRY